MKQGFYKYENGEWLYAQDTVISSSYTLLRDDKDTYTYPVDGWYWYDTSPVIEEVDIQYQLDKRTFGQRLIAEVQVELDVDTLFATNPQLVFQLVALTEQLFQTLENGWLSMAVSVIRNIPEDSLNEYITADLLLRYRNKLHLFLGDTQVLTYNE